MSNELAAASVSATPLATASVAEADPASAAASGIRGGRTSGRRTKRRRSVKRATILTHRWVSLALGIVLLIITTSGAAAVYAPEWVRWSNPSVFHVTHTEHPISVTDAIRIVEQAHPGFQPDAVNVYSGLDEVYSADEKHPGFYGVDPGTGRITGYANPNSGVMAFVVQVHECFFTCPEYPAYLGFLNHPVPTLGMHWLHGVTVANFILGVFGLVLIFLALSGLWLWWPSLRRFSTGFRVRLKKGRYARDYDLHQLLGLVAVPFLLIWGLTGASFEFHWVNTAWYAVTGGQQPADDTFASAPARKTTPDITPAQALASARALAGPQATIANLFLPEAGDPTGVYDIWFSRGFDQYRHGSYPGQFEVQVDRHNAQRAQVENHSTAPTVSNRLLDNYGGALFHFGQSFNGWWRLFWFIFGLAPLALAVTGVSTWLAKRRVRRRRRAGGADRGPAGNAAPAPAGVPPAAHDTAQAGASAPSPSPAPTPGHSEGAG